MLISLQKPRNTHMHTGHSVLSGASKAVGARGTLPDPVRISSFLVSSLAFPSINLHFANLSSRSQLAVYALKPEPRVQGVVHKAASMWGSGEYHFVVCAIPRRRISVSAFPISFFFSWRLLQFPFTFPAASAPHWSCRLWFQYSTTITALCSVSHSPYSKTITRHLSHFAFTLHPISPYGELANHPRNI